MPALPYLAYITVDWNPADWAASVAQLAEHWTSNPVVTGLNPIRGSSSVFFTVCLRTLPYLLSLVLICLYMYGIDHVPVMQSVLPPSPQPTKQNKTTQLFHTRTYSVNSYTLNIDNTRHTHTTIFQLYMYIPKCLCHFLGGALCTGTCMYSSHGNDVECTLRDKFIRTCMYVCMCTYMYIIVAGLCN